MMSDESDEFFRDLAREIRRLYWFECRQFITARTGKDPGHVEPEVPAYDGTEDAPRGQDKKSGRRYKSVWLRLARELTQRKIDPAVALEVTFTSTLGTRPPVPQAILSVKLDERVRRIPAVVEKEVRARMNAEATVAGMRLRRLGSTTALKPDQIYRLVITDSLLDLTPLCRMLLAVQSGHPDLAAKYERPAMRQYLCHPDVYDRVLSDQLPAAFRAVARSLMQSPG